MDDIAIKVDNVSKTFKLPHEKHNSVKSLFVNLFRGRRTYEKQHVLNDVSFEIKKGEFFGIVGRNGSGKSTLLKLIAGIYTPDKGTIHVNGKLTPFIELGVGFNHELTGRENVFLNGALLGFNRKEMEAMYDDIVAFAELEKFMDQKLKNYSSGMQVRLAFSIAIRAKSDILLLDEVLAVGDANFQRKCYDYFRELKRTNKTVIFISHDINAVKEYCDRAILINDSRLIKTGDLQDTLEKYLKFMNQEHKKSVEREKKKLISKAKAASELKVDMTKSSVKITDENILISYTLKLDDSISSFNSAFSVKDGLGNKLFGTNTEKYISQKNQSGKVTVDWKMKNVLSAGNYLVNVAVFDTENNKQITFEDVLEFDIKDKPQNHFSVNPVTECRLTSVK